MAVLCILMIRYTYIIVLLYSMLILFALIGETRFGNTYYIDEHYTRMSPMNLSFIRGMRKLANKAKQRCHY